MADTEDDDFYITLPSVASLSTFPLNNQANWITLLNPPLQLTGNWEVGLSEIHLPNKWSNITSSNNEFNVTFGEYARTKITQIVPTTVINTPFKATPQGPPVGTFYSATFSHGQLPHGVSLMFEMKIDLDHYYTRAEYMEKLQEGLEIMADYETTNGAETAKFKQGVRVLYRPYKRDGKTYYIYELVCEKDWVFLFDADSLEPINIQMGRFFGVKPQDLFKPITKQMRMNAFDNLNGTMEEFKAKLSTHKIYLYNTKILNTKHHLVERKQKILTLEIKTQNCKLQPGYYATPQHLVQGIMHCLPKQCHDYFIMTLSESNTLQIYSYNYEIFNIEIPYENFTLARMLGLRGVDIAVTLPKLSIDYDFTGRYTADLPIDINRSVVGFYVYCDLIYPEYVGDTKANLLRVIPINLDDLDVHNYSMATHYKKLSVKYITKIQIVIKTDADEEINFVGGKTLCKLHFRRKHKKV
jgi:hypothetical protein